MDFLSLKETEKEDYDEMLSRIALFEMEFEFGAQLHEEFRLHVVTKAAHSPLYQFWNSYLKMVEILLMFIRATRESDCKSHVAALRLMLPYFFALDCQNYARC